MKKKRLVRKPLLLLRNEWEVIERWIKDSKEESANQFENHSRSSRRKRQQSNEEAFEKMERRWSFKIHRSPRLHPWFRWFDLVRFSPFLFGLVSSSPSQTRFRLHYSGLNLIISLALDAQVEHRLKTTIIIRWVGWRNELWMAFNWSLFIEDTSIFARSSRSW